MPFRKYSLIKYLLVPPIAYVFYWAVCFEMGILGKSFIDAWTASYVNWIALFTLITLEALVMWREYHGKAQIVAAQTVTDNPFHKSTPNLDDTPDSVRSFMRSRLHTWDDQFERTLERFGRSSLPIRVLLKLKRLIYMGCFIFYIAFAIMSFTNPFFLVLFIFTAYAFLENLLWARHHQWAKRQRHDET